MNTIDAEINALEAQRYAAMLAADTAALETLLAPDLHFMHSNATADDKPSYIAKIAGGQIRYLSIDATDVDVRPYGDHALVFGHLRAEVVSGGQPRSLNSKFIGVWRASPAGWRFGAFAPTPLP